MGHWCAVKVKEGEVKVENIPNIGEFFDVFSKELLGLVLQ